eukprot:TRINITY_DN8494_c0_g2_i1.p1 TRINITY_DN8494_c0_g2~~TRINITY_DN8494_c0_g2_i1.p1  ORF type:complete len:271 (+),score=70.69 TRINITY_DN8494_c0_g2_i1:250-1062(+)
MLLRPKVEYLQLDKVQLEQDLKAASERINVIIKAKNAVDVVNNEVKEDLEKCRDELKNQEEANAQQRLDTEYWRGKAIELERENLLSESQKSALEKESEITRNSLSEKIKMLEERVAAEMEAKDSLIAQANKEEKSHSEARNALLKVASELEDYKFKYRNTDNILQNKSKALDELLIERSNLQADLLKVESERDVMKLEVDKNAELLKRLDIFYKTKLEAKKEKVKRLKQERSLSKLQTQLAYEDLYSRCSQLYESLNEYVTKVWFRKYK